MTMKTISKLLSVIVVLLSVSCSKEDTVATETLSLLRGTWEVRYEHTEDKWLEVWHGNFLTFSQNIMSYYSEEYRYAGPGLIDTIRTHVKDIPFVLVTDSIIFPDRTAKVSFDGKNKCVLTSNDGWGIIMGR